MKDMRSAYACTFHYYIVRYAVPNVCLFYVHTRSRGVMLEARFAQSKSH